MQRLQNPRGNASEPHERQNHVKKLFQELVRERINKKEPLELETMNYSLNIPENTPNSHFSTF
jgi:hypothetical protein